jgi:hypothetical protein
MRKQLAKEEGSRKKFTGIFSRFGKKTNFKGYSDETLLLTNIIDTSTNKIVADHVWFTLTKGFESLRLTPGDVIEFEARVKEYSKGYVNRRYKINNQSKDFKLSHPTKIKLVK